MKQTRCKICGITRVEDGLAAAHLGADAIGLVFYPPSRRNIDLDGARAIVAALPPFVTSVGLFVDAEPQWVRSAIERVGLDLLQFHGSEGADYCRSFGRAYLKAIRMREDADWSRCEADYGDAAGLLADTWHADVAGGTGETFDWSRLPSRRRLPLVLAGGLNATNVGAAIGLVKPWAVDISGGVESAPGIKSPQEMAAFMAAIAAVELSEQGASA